MSGNKYTSWLSNNAISITSIVVAIVVPFLLYFFWQRKRKKLVYEIISISPVVSYEIGNKLELRFNGKTITEAYSVVIKFTNTGNQPIRDTDFKSPIKINSFGENILNAEVTGSNIPGLKQEAEWTISAGEQSQVTLKPLLLNPKDSITTNFLVEGKVTKIEKPTARIEGVTEITQKSPLGKPSFWIAVFEIMSIMR